MGPENTGLAVACTRYVFDPERHPVIIHLARHLQRGAVAVEVAHPCFEAPYGVLYLNQQPTSRKKNVTKLDTKPFGLHTVGHKSIILLTSRLIQTYGVAP